MLSDQVPRDSSAAERMRRYRRRKRGGLRCLTVQIRQSEIEALVNKGLLSADERANADAILQALYAFLDRALRVTRNLPRSRGA